MRWLAVALVLILGACQERPAEHVRKKAEPAAEAPAPEPPAPAEEARSVPKRRARGCTTPLVQAAVKPRRDDVTRCYRKALAKNPAAAGKLSVEIQIDRQGEAKYLGVKTDEIEDEDFTRCVFSILRTIEFPLPDKPPCIVVYPFVFSAG